MMARTILPLSLLLLLLAGPALGDYLPDCFQRMIHIIREDAAGVLYPAQCHHFVDPGEPFKLHFILGWNESYRSAARTDPPRYPIRQIEFPPLNWLPEPSPEQGRMEYNWLADQVGGNIEEGLSLEWTEFQNSTIMISGHELPLLGTVEMEAYDSTWPPEPLVVDFLNTGRIWTDCGDWFEFLGLGFAFDTVENCDFLPTDPPNSMHFACCFQPTDGAGVSGEFQLEFDAHYNSCWYPGLYDLTVSVLVFDEVVLEFERSDFGFDVSEEISVAMDARGLAAGTVIPVQIMLDSHFGGDGTWIANLSYVVDETATEASSFSAIKSNY